LLPGGLAHATFCPFSILLRPTPSWGSRRFSKRAPPRFFSGTGPRPQLCLYCQCVPYSLPDVAAFYNTLARRHPSAPSIFPHLGPQSAAFSAGYRPFWPVILPGACAGAQLWPTGYLFAPFLACHLLSPILPFGPRCRALLPCISAYYHIMACVGLLVFLIAVCALPRITFPPQLCACCAFCCYRFCCVPPPCHSRWSWLLDGIVVLSRQLLAHPSLLSCVCWRSIPGILTSSRVDPAPGWVPFSLSLVRMLLSLAPSQLPHILPLEPTVCLLPSRRLFFSACHSPIFPAGCLTYLQLPAFYLRLARPLNPVC